MMDKSGIPPLNHNKVSLQLIAFTEFLNKVSQLLKVTVRKGSPK